jgi:hypothetical protein
MTHHLAVFISLCLSLMLASCHREPAPTMALDGGVAEPDAGLALPGADQRAARGPEASGPPFVDTWPPRGPGQCYPGEQRWCDGLVYDGWGLADCDVSTGKWKMKTLNGQTILDCRELDDGRRPDTLCACYHFFTNPACCERPDCILPPGTQGQICPVSRGQLCDYCNPLVKDECQEPGARCIVTNTQETFCGRECSSSSPCPAGYNCLAVKLQVGTSLQCVPSDFSCYY